jgi:hypothetical protein
VSPAEREAREEKLRVAVQALLQSALDEARLEAEQAAAQIAECRLLVASDAAVATRRGASAGLLPQVATHYSQPALPPTDTRTRTAGSPAAVGERGADSSVDLHVPGGAARGVLGLMRRGGMAVRVSQVWRELAQELEPRRQALAQEAREGTDGAQLLAEAHTRVARRQAEVRAAAHSIARLLKVPCRWWMAAVAAAAYDARL